MSTSLQLEAEVALEAIEFGLVGLVDLRPAVAGATVEARIAVVRDVASEISAAALYPGALLVDLALQERDPRAGRPLRAAGASGDLRLAGADRPLELLERLRIVLLQVVTD